MSSTLLKLLQLASPALPVGAYAYSEGLEFLIQTEQITTAAGLHDWIVAELTLGAIRIDAAVMVRAYQAEQQDHQKTIQFWQHWLTAARDSEVLRLQSLQMGRSLWQLFLDLEGRTQAWTAQEPHHFAISFGRVAGAWNIDLTQALVAFLHSWAGNLVNAGVKLIPLGQTHGQQLLLSLNPTIVVQSQELLTLTDEDLQSCSWAQSLAAMGHETLYSRLFRS